MNAAPQRLPQTMIEWLFSIYNPYEYMLQWQTFGTTVQVGQGLTNGNNIQPPEPVYVFGFNSAAWLAASGGGLVFPYRVGLADPAGNDWFNGQWASENVTANSIRGNQVVQYPPPWRFPREVKENQILKVTVNNNVNAAQAAAVVDAVIWGYTPRRRARALKPVYEVGYVPQTWEEWVWTLFDRQKQGLYRQSYSCTIAAGAGLATQTNIINVPEDLYVFGWKSSAWVTASGANTTWPYRLGIKNATTNDWTNGQWASAAVVGSDQRALSLGGVGGQEWMLPREVARNEVLTVTVDNNVNAASEAITVDVTIYGYEIRERRPGSLNLTSE